MTDADLRARVDALERTVALLHSDLRRSRARPLPALGTALWALTAALIVSAPLVGLRAADNGPLVLGPGGVVVTNAEGKPALTMQSLPGRGGRIAVFNGTGQPVAQLISSGDQCCGRLEILQDGKEEPKVTVGVSGTNGAVRMRSDTDALSQISAAGFAVRGESSPEPVVTIRDDAGGMIRLRAATGTPTVLLSSEDTNGLIRAYGPPGIATVLGSSDGIGMLRLNSTKAQAAMLAQGDGKIYFTNASGTGVLAIGGNDNGGYVVALNNAGKEASTVSVEPDGSGRVQLWRSGELSLIAGTTEGRGDLCVNGTKGKLCMGLLGVKTFTPY